MATTSPLLHPPVSVLENSRVGNNAYQQAPSAALTALETVVKTPLNSASLTARQGQTFATYIRPLCPPHPVPLRPAPHPPLLPVWLRSSDVE